mmetsp:Transcript_9014/g.11971  ORF Transcript_9014/g.11971 Transcript_9014/m.11971 type:complete len:168 (+) Transcript_9014:121-624(+)|eukprot:CAMPEP_0117808848 /NCGR_PEP_ID=MMETSP0948-20121206/20315_1 /TAXON_ID=44440 /ORGANISM="Chattonella subsalsa, Strain CCMP2191" /LENGTH=167 /DNA_ID=CAMNT_0005644407 /DNA_START=81 /DNA_END=584 /DNA_ORIENTATION=+
MNDAASSPKWFAEKFGETVLTKEGIKNVDEVLQNKKLIFIYFSAHWCPPCRGFTPVLSEFYKKHKEVADKDDQIEVIFVSGDRNEQEFQSYFESMADWTAIPFNSQQQRNSLNYSYGVQGIPTLVVICGETGETKTASGRMYIDPGNTKAVVDKLSKMEPNKCCCVM